MDKLLNFLNGYKTYVTAVIGILIAIAGHYWGPLEIGGTTIPQIDSGAMWKVIWDGLLVVFIRKGIRTS